MSPLFDEADVVGTPTWKHTSLAMQLDMGSAVAKVLNVAAADKAAVTLFHIMMSWSVF